MYFLNANGDGEELLLAVVLGVLIGAFCGAIPLVVGLIRGNTSMAWTGFGFCVFLGIACSPIPVSLLPALVFTIIIGVTEPIEKKKKRGPKRRRRIDRADDLLDETDGPKRKRDYDEDDDRPRRRRRYEDDEDDYDRPRRRRPRYDD